MTPAELDILLNGAFIYEALDGTRYASWSYKLRDYGCKMVGRTGALTDADLARPSTDVLADLNAAIVTNISGDCVKALVKPNAVA